MGKTTAHEQAVDKANSSNTRYTTQLGLTANAEQGTPTAPSTTINSLFLFCSTERPECYKPCLSIWSQSCIFKHWWWAERQERLVLGQVAVQHGLEKVNGVSLKKFISEIFRNLVFSQLIFSRPPWKNIYTKPFFHGTLKFPESATI